MSITPNEILDKQFSISFRGYDRDEVDKFLEAVAHSLTSVIKELNTVKDEAAALRAKLDSLQEREEEFRRALTTAHTFAEEMKQQARKDSEIMLEQARMDAERIISDAHQEAIQLEDSIRGLRRIQREAVFKIRSSIEGYLHMLDDAMLPPEELDNLLSAAASDMRAIQGKSSIRKIEDNASEMKKDAELNDFDDIDTSHFDENPGPEASQDLLEEGQDDMMPGQTGIGNAASPGKDETKD